jgi:uncharacterized protein
MGKFLPPEAFRAPGTYRLLPFTFERLDDVRVVMTNLSGEYLVTERAVLELLVDGVLPPAHPQYATLRSRHFLREETDRATEALLELKLRTRTEHLARFTGLHIFVASLRCDHSCPYCQVSRRQDSDSRRYDMSWETAEAALELMFRSPNPALKLEFQGGEPLLNFALIERLVPVARERAAREGKVLSVVVATTLSLATDEMLRFFRDQEVDLSCSLDGPRDLHNANRPRPGKDSYERFVDGLRRARDIVGRDRVSALMTTTERSLTRVRDIVDEYVALGFPAINLRPLSPYGFAMKTRQYDAYGTQRFLDFYFEGLEYILSLNARGIAFQEGYAALILTKMLSHQDPGYVDLMSPAGIGLGALVYDYDGSVFASDEARMLAQMGDAHFRLGHVATDSYEALITNPNLLAALEDSFTLSVPQCSECAFEPFCGADPVQHHALTGDVVGRKPESEFCHRNLSLFRYLIGKLEDDPQSAHILRSWVRH